MAFLGGLAKAGLFGIVGKTLAPSAPSTTPQVITPIAPTRNAAADAARQADLLRRRRGSAANDYAGAGAEASTAGGRTLLGQAA